MSEHPAQCDKIYIRDLSVRCLIGINEDERIEKQDVIINIILYTDLKKAGQTDRIEDAVNYKTVKKDILTLAEGSSYFLIEKLAEEISGICLGYTGIQKVNVMVDKPGALRHARSVAVEIIRMKGPDE